MSKVGLSTRLADVLFNHRRLVIVLFAILTVAMAISASRLRVDAGFNKLLPLDHPYMKVFRDNQREFGGANTILVALMAREGDIFTPEFFDSLRKATDDVFYLPGVDRSHLYSLFTPNVRFTEVVEDGIAAGPIVPATFAPTAEGLHQVRENVLKSEYVGRLVANDFSGAIISASLLEVNPQTGEKIDYVEVAHALEGIRAKYEQGNIDVRIIGFAKMIGDMTDGAKRVILFFGIAFLVAAIMVYLYTRSFVRTWILLLCCVVAVIWELGMLPLLGFGIDPMGILVPFLVFAIGVSHGVQMVSAHGAELFDGANGFDAAKAAFRRLLAPGIIALASDTVGFLTIWLIEIRIIQEMAITASLGVAMIILSNLILLPVLLSYLARGNRYRTQLHRRAARMAGIWAVVARVSDRKPAAAIIMVGVLLCVVGVWKGADIQIGDMQQGVPELRPESRYNVDSMAIGESFSIGVDVMTVFAQTSADGCIDYNTMTAVDDFGWHLANVDGVQSVVSLPTVAKLVNAGWNEGSPEWRVLPRNSSVMVQAISQVPTSSGLLNSDCSIMPVYVYTKDHKAGTIADIVAAAKQFEPDEVEPGQVGFSLAGGNVGVMAATNEEVVASQFPILLYVFAAVVVLCLATFRSLPGTLCILLPLALVSLLSYAIMAVCEIGLKVNTLPVVALGVGVGVDYGIYIYSRLRSILEEGKGMREAYELTLDMTGNAVLLTGATLAVGVATWIFSPLKFQADMGVLLTFMFFVNMLGALILLPALASWIHPRFHRGGNAPEAEPELREVAGASH